MPLTDLPLSVASTLLAFAVVHLDHKLMSMDTVIESICGAYQHVGRHNIVAH